MSEETIFKKKMSWKKKLLLASPFIIIAIIMISQDTQKGDEDIRDMHGISSIKKGKESRKLQAKIGDIITTNKFEITVTSLQTRDSVGIEFSRSRASEGAIYVAVEWKFKNITNRPISSFSQSKINIVDENGVKYSKDLEASINYAMEVDIDRKVLSNIGYGVLNVS